MKNNLGSICWYCARSAVECQFLKKMVPYQGSLYDIKTVYNSHAQDKRMGLYVMRECPFYKE